MIPHETLKRGFPLCGLSSDICWNDNWRSEKHNLNAITKLRISLTIFFYFTGKGNRPFYTRQSIIDKFSCTSTENGNGNNRKGKRSVRVEGLQDSGGMRECRIDLTSRRPAENNSSSAYICVYITVSSGGEDRLSSWREETETRDRHSRVESFFTLMHILR